MPGLPDARTVRNSKLLQISAESDGCSESGSCTGTAGNFTCKGKLRTTWLAVASLLAVSLVATLAQHHSSWLLFWRSNSAADLTGTVGEVVVKAGKCKSSKTWCDKGEVGLFCFSQIVSGGTEEELVKLQLKKGASIFACDDYLVTCAQRRLLGTSREGHDVHTTINSETGRVKMGDVSSGATTSSFLNVLIFMKAWDLAIDSGKVWSQDWTVKVDPDAVFFPSVMREHLKHRTGGDFKMTYTLNCREKHWKQDDISGNGHFYRIPKLYGAVEAFNKKAIGAYKDAGKECKKALKWQKWGEDLFMHRCMQMMGADTLVDYKQVGDDRCPDNPPSECKCANRAAYHPYKEIHEWFRCYNASMEGMGTKHCDLKKSTKSSGTVKPFGKCGGVGTSGKECEKGWTCVHKSEWFWQCLQQ